MNTNEKFHFIFNGIQFQILRFRRRFATRRSKSSCRWQKWTGFVGDFRNFFLRRIPALIHFQRNFRCFFGNRKKSDKGKIFTRKKFLSGPTLSFVSTSTNKISKIKNQIGIHFTVKIKKIFAKILIMIFVRKWIRFQK